MKLLGEEFSLEQEFPATYRWHTKLIALPGVHAGLEKWAYQQSLNPEKYENYRPFMPMSMQTEEARRSMWY